MCCGGLLAKAPCFPPGRVSFCVKRVKAEVVARARAGHKPIKVAVCDVAVRYPTPVHQSACGEMDEPMSAAGAQLAGERNKSETERALERATDRAPKQK